MSELENPVAETVADVPLGAGAMLSSAREAAGMHVAALAVALKVPVKRLEALEAERWDELPDAVFTRALAGSVCRVLKIDPSPVLSRLPAAPSATMTVETGLNEPFRHTGGANLGLAGKWQLGSRSLIFAVAVLIIAALALMVWPAGERLLAQWISTRMDGSTVPTEDSPQSRGSQGTAQATMATDALVVSPQVPAMGAEPAIQTPSPTGGASAVSVSTASDETQVPAGVVVPPESNRAASMPQVPGSTDLLVFRASAESWVEVTDSHGAVVFRKLLVTGEAARVSGSLPLSVLVGRADVTSVEVKGQPIDLKAQTRNNVARFEVK